MSLNKMAIRNYCIILALLLIALIVPAKSEYRALNLNQIADLVPSSTRYIESLTGKWEMSHDQTNWEAASLPYSEPYTKAIYYRRAITLDKDYAQRYSWHLYLMGIDDEIEIYFNEQFIGRFFGGMAPFYVRIPSKMIANSNNMLKLVTIPADHASRQIKEQNMYTRKVQTGILREVLLVGTPNVWTSDIKIKNKFSDNYSKCEVSATVKVSSGDLDKFWMTGKDSSSNFNLSKAVVNVETIIRKKLTGEMVANGGSHQLEIQKERTATLNFTINVNSPALWNVYNPVIHQLIVRITKNGQLIDEIADDFGFKYAVVGIANKMQVIKINGEPLDIKGVDYIEDYRHFGYSFSTDRMEQDVNLLKTLGANLIRFRYYVPHPYFVKLCDKYGIFVLIELPVYDVPNSIINSDEIKVRMKNLCERIINSYGNHPSVIAWGLSDGADEGSEESISFTNYMLKLFRSYSPLLIYKNILISSKKVDYNGFDFIGIRDIGIRGNLDQIKMNLLRLRQLSGSKPLFFNYGSIVQPTNHNGYSDPASIESQANYLFNLYYMVKNLSLNGSVLWTFNDYELENPLLIINNDYRLISTCGLVDRDRQQRKSFSTMQALFNGEKDPLYYAGSWTESTPVSFVIFGLFLCLVIALLINRFKRFREYLFRSILRPYNFYADIRDQRIMSSLHTYILGIVISMTMGIFLASIFYYYRTSDIAQYILSILFPSSSFRESLFGLIWMPELLTFIITAIFFAMIFIISGIIKLASTLVKGRIFFSDTYTIAIWAGTPILALLPISIILNRLIVFSPAFIAFLIILFIVITVWVFLRILRATAIVFDIREMKSFMVGISSCLVVLTFILAFYQYQFSIFAYTQYLFKVLLNF